MLICSNDNKPFIRPDHKTIIRGHDMMNGYNMAYGWIGMLVMGVLAVLAIAALAKYLRK